MIATSSNQSVHNTHENSEGGARSNESRFLMESNDERLSASSKPFDKWHKIKKMTSKYLKKKMRTKSKDLNSYTQNRGNYRRRIKQTKSIDISLNEAIKKFFPLPNTPLTLFQKQSPTTTTKINQKLSLDSRSKIKSAKIEGRKRRKNLSFSGGKKRDGGNLKFGSKRTPSLTSNIMIYQNMILHKGMNKNPPLSSTRRVMRDINARRKKKGRILFEDDENLRSDIPLKIQ